MLNHTIAVVQMSSVSGNVRVNLATMLKNIAEARERGAEIVVFPELCISGYMLGDRWEHDAFIREIEDANECVQKASSEIVVVWGSVRADWKRIGEDGRVRKYNAAFIAGDTKWVSNGRLDGWVPKTNLPKYRIFDDARHFYPAASLAQEVGCDIEEILSPFVVSAGGRSVRLALSVCEDLWEDEYQCKPSRIYGNHGANLLIDISCSPWTVGKWRARERMLKNRVKDSGIPILYVNTVGLQDNGKNLVWFDGASSFVDTNQSFCWRAQQHEEGLYALKPEMLLDSSETIARPSEIEEIHLALLYAMRAFFRPFPKVIVGLSGGVDSAVSLALLVEAIGSEKVLAVNMPTQYNSRTTQLLAQQCAEANGVEYQVVPIQDLYCAWLRNLEGMFPDSTALVRENDQACIRGQQLASIARRYGGVFVCNGNKTEVALNYFTLYGDGAGAAAFLADIWKGQVYALARLINTLAIEERIPQGILDIVPSAELSEDQNVDEGKGDPIFYPYHDLLLRAFIEWRWDPTMVLERVVAGTLEGDLGCEDGTLEKYFPTCRAFVENLEWAWKQFNIEYKRVQLPPVFLASRRAFGFDRRETIAGAYFTERYYCLRDKYLS